MKKNSPEAPDHNSPDPIDIHVGSRIRSRRLSLDISQGNLGEILGITFQQVQKYERGTNRVSASRLYHLSQILKVPVTFFFEGYQPAKTKFLNPGKVKEFAWVEKPGGDLMTRKETTELITTYYSLRDVSVRRQFTKVISALVKSQ